jgi:hypothetical protein
MIQNLTGNKVHLVMDGEATRIPPGQDKENRDGNKQKVKTLVIQTGR